MCFHASDLVGLGSDERQIVPESGENQGADEEGAGNRGRSQYEDEGDNVGGSGEPQPRGKYADKSPKHGDLWPEPSRGAGQKENQRGDSKHGGDAIGKFDWRAACGISIGRDDAQSASSKRRDVIERHLGSE